jgi:arsenate reductase-like glutaredoxin family protein
MKLKDLVSIAISIVAILITISLFYLEDPENISSVTIAIFVTIISISMISAIVAYILSGWEKISKKVKDNKLTLERIDKSLKLKELYTDMEKRMSILEKIFEFKNKKAQTGIDPRIIFWVILAILLLLLAKSLGYF